MTVKMRSRIAALRRSGSPVTHAIGKNSIFKGVKEKSVKNILGQLWRMVKKNSDAASLIVNKSSVKVNRTVLEVFAVPRA